ncbi:hypothetical protein ONS95_006226 [Cadophora gregata]|uniref:uncharacterized protein n=1 Tax=Cadophora gregata TaxID=51156 RepID=UPI0026DC932B|nr:uncharacterized protein ONS95_006226 [Cadophora gregata]KAK0102618.1 hypothetical protein ONS95_006226 [Cadophora gregata]
MTISNAIYRGVAGDAAGAVVKSSVDISSDLGPKEILIKITHSSLCYTDIHMMSSGIALGHEGVGIIEKVGSGVTTLKVGDRAGGGYLRDSCGHCNYCTKGKDIFCYERNIFGEKDFNAGTFAEYYILTSTKSQKTSPPNTQHHFNAQEAQSTTPSPPPPSQATELVFSASAVSAISPSSSQPSSGSTPLYSQPLRRRRLKLRALVLRNSIS